MGKVTNQGAEIRMETETAFENSTGSLKGENIYIDGHRYYNVYSYGVLIAEVAYQGLLNTESGEASFKRVVWITPRKYSVTTSKHTGMARRALTKSINA
jgi:hypothetical protein